MAYAACHLERLLAGARHNFIDRPIELLRHQSAGHSNRCMKPVQSLPSHAVRQSRLHAYLFSVLSTDFRGKERLLADYLALSFVVILLRVGVGNAQRYLFSYDKATIKSKGKQVFSIQ